MDMQIHHFQCKSCGYVKVIECLGKVVSVSCPQCSKPMKEFEPVQTDFLKQLGGGKREK